MFGRLQVWHDSKGRDIRPLVLCNDRLYIACISYVMALDFARQAQIHRSRVQFISNEYTLRGVRGFTVYMVGPWRRIRHADELYSICLSQDHKMIEVPNWR
jgi:hypothetical protein